MPPEILARRIDAAIAMLFARDVFLLKNSTGERAVVSKLAGYMVPLFRGYDVDTEYNRRGVKSGDSKVLPGTLLKDCKAGRKALKAGKKDVKVFPDIIVHRRGILYKHNLLVVEVKRKTNREPRACDEAKIDAMMTKYKYRFGLFIDLPSGPGAAAKDVSLKWW